MICIKLKIYIKVFKKFLVLEFRNKVKLSIEKFELFLFENIVYIVLYEFFWSNNIVLYRVA